MKKLLCLLTAFAFICSPCVAQEAAKNKTLVLDDFSGGLATKLSNQSTPPKYARIAENVRLNSVLKALSKRDQIYVYGTADATEPITGMHRLYRTDNTKKLIVTHGDEIETGNDTTGAFTSILGLTTADYRWQWLTWHDLAIGTDGYNQPVKTDGTTATYLGTCYAKDNGAGAGPSGTYTYKVAFYSATKTYITNVASKSVTVTDNDIDLTMIPIGPDTILGETIVGRKIYRNAHATPGTWLLLTNGTIANNSATTLTDSDADAALGAAYPAGDETWTPPKGKLCLIHKNRLWIANNPTYPSRIYYSEDGSQDLFDPLGYFDIRTNDGDEIMFVNNLLGILTVGKNNTIQKIYTDGTDPSADWEISDPFSSIGCDAMYSAKDTPIGILYLSNSKDGLYLFNGQSSVLKSEAITPEIKDILASNLISVWGEYNNNVYYMAYASKTVGGSQNNRVLVYDMLADAFTIDLLSISAFCSFTGGGDGGLLCSGSSTDGKVYSYGLTNQSLLHGTFSDFIGTWDDMRYIPASQGGDPDNPILELAWDCTVDGWTAEMLGKDPTFDSTINDINTHFPTATIDRPDGSGTYICQVLNTPGASSYEKLYWNETLPTGTDVTFSVRGGTTADNCIAAGWTGTYTSPNGSDISGATAYDFSQYRITMTTSDTDYTPNITKQAGYDVKFTYKNLGSAAESTIGIHWQSGYSDFGIPAYKKALRKLIVYHLGTVGTVTIKVTNELGDSDSFVVDLSTNPTYYAEYFTTGTLTGYKFNVDIVNSDLNAYVLKSLEVIYDVEPIL